MKVFARTLVIALPVFIIVAAVVMIGGVRYAYEPGQGNVISGIRPGPEAWDLWGRGYTQQEAAALLRTDAGRKQLSPANGAVKIDEALLRLGRISFYKETFGNEIFLTDVMGILDGALRLTNVARAVFALHGEGTTNLRVEVPENITVGGRSFLKGSYFDTGLDVPPGALAPLGMAVVIKGARIRVGITCALCHAAVDPETKKVIEGAPNQDLNAGLLLALATNSASYFMHTDVHPLRDVAHDSHRTVAASDGRRMPLPEIGALEHDVDTALLMWPRGNFDSLTDMKADPTQNPSSFTWGNHPYGWSGNFMAGPFRGLSAQNNNVHALNSDSLLLADISPALFGIDREVYLAILLQNAPRKRFRYNPGSDQSPSGFLAAQDLTPGAPSLNAVVLPPSYPKSTLVSPDGTLTSSPGFNVWQQNNAMSAWQNTIVPPPARLKVDDATTQLGREVFSRARCDSCHSGPFLTNNRILPSAQLGSNPLRSQALQKTEAVFGPPVLYTFDTPVPLPPNPKPLPVPTSEFDQDQIDLAWAHHGSGGGYKVPSLVGLYWTAPYLHDGGVAVGPDRNSQLGLAGTVEKNIAPDPSNSLLALIDSTLRAGVVAANAASPALQRMNAQGVGHSYWVDEISGYTSREQQALIGYLLTYRPGQ
ncbi:MAG: hypothetical protein QOJ99_5457 [Bryobacterales bacterium]|nr:hypothetical protein [Bryobacterales bacterium]